MTEPEAQKLWTILLAAYASTVSRLSDEIQKAQAMIYRRMLADLEYPLANAAVERLLATCKFMPSIAEIREAALSTAHGEVRPGADAWGDVLKAVSKTGARGTPVFADPVVAKCVESLGWQNICLSENATADRARFIELYDRQASTQRRDHASGHLPAAQRYRELVARANALESGESPFTAALRLVKGGDEP